MNCEELNLDDDGIFNLLVGSPAETLEPNKYLLTFVGTTLKQQFEFLLQLTTELCKYFFGNEEGVVHLDMLSQNNFLLIDKYIKSLGFNCYFNVLPANTENLNYMYENRYDRININSNTNINELKFGIKCNSILYVISFSHILTEEYNSRNNNKRLNNSDNSDNSDGSDGSNYSSSKRIRISRS